MIFYFENFMRCLTQIFHSNWTHHIVLALSLRQDLRVLTGNKYSLSRKDKITFIYNNKNYAQFKKEMDQILEHLDYFVGEWSKTRYPKEKAEKVVTPSELYFLEDAAQAVEKARNMLQIIQTLLATKFDLKIYSAYNILIIK